jgi:hypothetical protein
MVDEKGVTPGCLATRYSLFLVQLPARDVEVFCVRKRANV